MKTNHTHGDWKTRRQAKSCAHELFVTTQGGGEIILAQGITGQGWVEQVANAHLIEQAPRVADLLQGIVNDASEVLDGSDLDYETFCQAILERAKELGIVPTGSRTEAA